MFSCFNLLVLQTFQVISSYKDRSKESDLICFEAAGTVALCACLDATECFLKRGGYMKRISCSLRFL